MAQTGLFSFNGRATFVAEHAIDEANVMASLDEKALDFTALSA